MDTRKWEYKVTEMPKGITFDHLERELDSWGADGWELCGIEYGAFIFKRETE